MDSQLIQGLTAKTPLFQKITLLWSFLGKNDRGKVIFLKKGGFWPGSGGGAYGRLFRARCEIFSHFCDFSKIAFADFCYKIDLGSGFADSAVSGPRSRVWSFPCEGAGSQMD